MKCSHCGRVYNSHHLFCEQCGAKLENLKKDNSKIYKTIVLSLLCVVMLLLIGVVIVILNDEKSVKTRTIMIYLSGSDLESKNGIATSDLESIDSSKIDLNTTNVLVYAGGTEKWFNNYTSSSENNILLLTENGFEKIQSDSQRNMGDSNTFSTFLSYAYDNFKTDRYDLIIYDHGLGALGSVYDDFAKDFLSLIDMKLALEQSPFNSKNKLETVLFRTCLNGTAEVADLYSNYANYMIASEEVTLGNSYNTVLAFLDNVEVADNGELYGNKFITGYGEFINSINMYGNIDYTYSIIDLNKQDELEKNMNDFFNSIDVSSNYSEISKIRANIHQYAVESTNSTEYDTIDLYGFVDSIKHLSPQKADKVLKTIKSMVKTNWTSNKYSNGLSIYFPYYGSSGVKNNHFTIYETIGFSNEYYSFIKDFTNIKEGNANFSLDLSKNDTNLDNKVYKLELTDEQVKSFAKANYVIYEKNADGTYSLVSKAKAELDNNVLIGKLSNNVIMISNDKTKTYIPVKQIDKVGKNIEYTTSVILSRRNEDNKYESSNGNMHLIIKDNKVKESYIIKTNKNMEGGSLLKTKDYSTLTFEHTKWNILDKNGNYIGPSKTDSMTVFEYSIKDGYKLSLESLDDSKYYCVFEIYDVNNKVYYSKFDEIN